MYSQKNTWYDLLKIKKQFLINSIIKNIKNYVSLPWNLLQQDYKQTPALLLASRKFIDEKLWFRKYYTIFFSFF